MYFDKFEDFKKSLIGKSGVKAHIRMEKAGYIHENNVRDLPNGGIEVVFVLTSGGFTIDTAVIRISNNRVTSIR